VTLTKSMSSERPVMSSLTNCPDVQHSIARVMAYVAKARTHRTSSVSGYMPWSVLAFWEVRRVPVVDDVRLTDECRDVRDLDYVVLDPSAST
jgi:hypothetical protein